jgi:hypothetical protein
MIQKEVDCAVKQFNKRIVDFVDKLIKNDDDSKNRKILSIINGLMVLMDEVGDEEFKFKKDEFSLKED